MNLFLFFKLITYYLTEFNVDSTPKYQNLNILPNNNLCITGSDNMITCNVCGHLNSPERATCENCGSDLSDSPDWDIFEIDDFGDDMLDFDDAEELGYVDPDDYE